MGSEGLLGVLRIRGCSRVARGVEGLPVGHGYVSVPDGCQEFEGTRNSLQEMGRVCIYLRRGVDGPLRSSGV